MKNLTPFTVFHTPDVHHVDGQEALAKQQFLQDKVAGLIPEDYTFSFDRAALENQLHVEVTEVLESGERRNVTKLASDLLSPNDLEQFWIIYLKLRAAIAE